MPLPHGSSVRCDVDLGFEPIMELTPVTGSTATVPSSSHSALHMWRGPLPPASRLARTQFVTRKPASLISVHLVNHKVIKFS